MPEANKSDSISEIIALNQEEWNRLKLVLSNPEGTSVVWINCDTDLIKKPLHDALTKQFTNFTPFDINVNQQTESLKKVIIFNEKDNLSPNPLIHIFGIENALKNDQFRSNLNFERESLFRSSPGNVIFWADFATGTILHFQAYDFWSWMSLTFDFMTPPELLTSRQKEFDKSIWLKEREIQMPEKNSADRIRHLEHEWDEFMISVKHKPSTSREMSDAVIIARSLAKEFHGEGNYRKAISVLEKILNCSVDLINASDKIHIESELSISYRHLGDLELAKEHGEKALLNILNLYDIDHPEIAAIQADLSLVYQDSGELNKAKELLEKAIENAIKNYGESDFKAVIRRSNLATVYRDLGDLVKAKDLMEKVLENQINNFGATHPTVATIQSNLAVVYSELGNLNKAKELLEEALASDLKNFGENHPKISTRYNNLAYIYADLKLPSKAKEYMQKAYEIRKNVLGGKHNYTLNSLNFLKELEEKESQKSK